MRQARLELEERIRKEKRAKQMEEIRKPILTTPRMERDRQNDGNWDKTVKQIRPETHMRQEGCKTPLGKRVESS